MIRVRTSLCTLLAVLFGCSTTQAAPPEGKPVLVPMWKRTTIGLPKADDLNFDFHEGSVQWHTKLFSRLTDDRQKARMAIIPPAIPKVLDDLVIYVNDYSIASCSLRENQSIQPPSKPGELRWYSQNDDFNCIGDLASKAVIERWLEDHGRSDSDLILHHSRRCSFSVDGKTIQYVNDLTILPPKAVCEAALDDKEILKHAEKFGGIWLTGLVLGNDLKVLDAESGKLVQKFGREPKQISTTSTFRGGIFLGAPFPVGVETLVIHEKAKTLYLSKLNWVRIRKAIDAGKDYSFESIQDVTTKTITWHTELALAPASIIADPHRRIHAIHLVENKGLILCPTHLGRVVAVDSKTGKIQWTHEYAPLDAKRFPTFAPEWVVVPPVVVGDKYIYAPADFPELLCLNVADGKKVWSVKKGDGLYPAVVGEQVLVIGEKTLRSLSLKDGSEQWKLDLPGLPCGRGAMLGDKYLLPFSEPKTWKGMIAIVDLKAGKIAEVLKPEKDEPIGNLVVHQEFLISQTLTEIAVFPIKK